MARRHMLVDYRGRPIMPRELVEERSAPTLGGVRNILTTHPATGLTPQRLASILRAAEQPGGADRYLELAEEMEERDLHYMGVLQTRKRQVAQIGVLVEPATDDAEHVADAELVMDFFAREEIEDELFDMLDSVGKGFSVAEILWETSERQWMPSRLEHRLPQWFDFDQHTGSMVARRVDAATEAQAATPGSTTSAGGGWIQLEPWKFVVHTTRAKSGLPIRGGLARCAAWAWLFKNLTIKDWVRFCEAYGQPLRIGRYHDAASDEDREVLLQAVTNIAADAAAILPVGMQVEFVDDPTARGRSEIYRDLVHHIDQQMSIAVLGQSLTTQEGDSGSYSLGRIHNEVRHDIERSDGRQLAATLRRDLVAPMVQLNRGQPKDGRFPVVRIQREEAVDLNLLAESLARLVPLGLRVKVEQIRTLFRLDEPGADDAVLMPSTPAGMPPAGDREDDVQAMGRTILRRIAMLAADTGDEVDRATDDLLLGGWRPLMEPALEPVLAAARSELERGGSFDDFTSRLPRLLAEMDASGVASALEYLAFSARISEGADGG